MAARSNNAIPVEPDHGLGIALPVEIVDEDGDTVFMHAVVRVADDAHEGVLDIQIPTEEGHVSAMISFRNVRAVAEVLRGWGWAL